MYLNVGQMPPIENPSHLEELTNVERFFVFGNTPHAVRTHLLLVGRFPAKFYGFLVSEPTSERQWESQFSLRYWKEALPQLGPGDLVFMAIRDGEVEARLWEQGVRVARQDNLLLTAGTYETPTFLHFCRTHIERPGVALDIGGNTGLTGAILSKFSTHVHIFEANPEMERSIHATNEGNTNLTVHMKAVCRTCGTVPIYAVGTNNTSLVPRGEKTAAVMVPSVSIDDFCLENNIVPNVIKIDVEGVDGEVVLGGTQTIASHQPAIFIEHPLHTISAYDTDEKSASEAMDFLAESYDLRAYPVMDQLYPSYALNMPLADFIEEFKGFPTNVAAIPRS